MGRSLWGVTPRQSIDAACSAYGRSVVVQACIDLLEGDDVDPLLVRALGGPRADALLGQALPQVAALAHDPVPRVQQAASRASTRLTAAGA